MSAQRKRQTKMGFFFWAPIFRRATPKCRDFGWAPIFCQTSGRREFAARERKPEILMQETARSCCVERNQRNGGFLCLGADVFGAKTGKSSFPERKKKPLSPSAYESKQETNFGVFSLDAALQILDFRVFSSALTERAANGTFRPVAIARAKKAARETRRKAKMGSSKRGEYAQQV